MLYKYLSCDRGLGIIEKRLIRFSQFDVLNDPFESSSLSSVIPLMRISYDKTERLLKAHGVDSELVNAKAFSKELESPHVEGQIISDYISTQIGILSLSRNHQNMLMWAHYADSHSGLAIGLDETHGFFHDSGDESFEPALKKVTYSQNRKVHVNIDSEDWFCDKSIHWAYEEEERLFKDFSLRDQIISEENKPDVYLFEIPLDAIKCVYIGANMSLLNEQQCIKNLQTYLPHADIYKSSLNIERYELDFEKIGVN